MKPLTEEIIAQLITRDRWQKNIVLARYTPADWWENDVCEITASDYWVEYEIKLTVSDFRRDAKDKTREKYQADWDAPKIIENKHDLLTKTDRGPARFFYVVPRGLLDNIPIPQWAGLIEVYDALENPYLRQTVDAPRRHKRKDPQLRAAIFETCYWRLHRR